MDEDVATADFAKEDAFRSVVQKVRVVPRGVTGTPKERS